MCQTQETITFGRRGRPMRAEAVRWADLSHQKKAKQLTSFAIHLHSLPGYLIEQIECRMPRRLKLDPGVYEGGTHECTLNLTGVSSSRTVRPERSESCMGVALQLRRLRGNIDGGQIRVGGASVTPDIRGPLCYRTCLPSFPIGTFQGPMVTLSQIEIACLSADQPHEFRFLCFYCLFTLFL